jgi:hypothetical protein
VDPVTLVHAKWQLPKAVESAASCMKRGNARRRSNENDAPLVSKLADGTSQDKCFSRPCTASKKHIFPFEDSL